MDIEIISTPTGDACYYYSEVNKDDQPLGLAAYIRIGSNTYCLEISNSDDNRVLKKDEIAAFKEYVQSIEKFSGNES